jgi:hypothetical protein
MIASNDHLLSILARPLSHGKGEPMADFDVNNDLHDPLLKARAMIEMVRLATQADDELRSEIVYEAMLAVEDILNAALAGLQPLIEEDEQCLQDAFKRLREGGL